MKLAKIKVIENRKGKTVYINNIKQDCVISKVETEVLPGEITEVKVSYLVEKFEVIRKEG